MFSKFKSLSVNAFDIYLNNLDISFEDYFDDLDYDIDVDYDLLFNDFLDYLDLSQYALKE